MICFFISFSPNPELPQCNPSGPVDILINRNTQMSSLGCGPWLCLNLYFYECLLKSPPVLVTARLKRSTHSGESSLSGSFETVSGHVWASECMYFVLTYASVKSAIWSLKLSYSGKSKACCSPQARLRTLGSAREWACTLSGWPDCRPEPSEVLWKVVLWCCTGASFSRRVTADSRLSAHWPST